ncbi:MAG: hypothetical protein FD147_331 [Chloroflexi bacterium]|nr:MAG: hypothetical protein FD147_331 [Chloroflexota bacterium]
MTAIKLPQTLQSFPPEKQSNSGFLIFCFAMMLMLSIAVLLPLYPNDFFPYMRIGQEIIKTGGIPTTEFMTYTRFDEPAVYLYWLPSLIFLGVYNLGGVTLVGIVSALCIGSFYALLWMCLREFKAGPLTSGFVLLITAVVGINYWATRPQIFTYPLFGLALLALIRWQRRDDRLLWFIPLIAMLWANFHGSFIVLFFLTLPALIFGGGNRKRLLIVTVIALLATLINRYGFNLWLNMVSMVNNDSIKLFSLEWKLPVNDGWQANIFFATLLVIPVLTAITKPKIQLFYWIWFLGFGWMALSAVRYGVWFLAIEAFLLAMLLSPIFERYLERSDRFQNRTVNLVIGILLLMFPITLLPGIRGLWWQQAPPVYNDRTPVAAAEWIKHNPQLPGELWSDFTYSTYLTYALPERKLFMTNRFEDFPAGQFLDNKRIAEADYDWQSLLDKYGINLLMPSVTLQPDLISAASASADWAEVYRDEMTVLFVRNHP